MRKHERPRLGTGGAAGDALRQHHSTAETCPNQAPPEADDLPPGITTLADSLAQLAAILPRLADALDGQNRPEPLAFRKHDAARMCCMSTREWERLLSAGKAPKPDAYVGRCPVWKRSTLEAWIARGGSK